ncbi:MAG: divergent polysaccharide deacetylase family protein [Minwuia sp.]|nr:divergent polysaccharide deacetylase family protein [Minwuia sp.]
MSQPKGRVKKVIGQRKHQRQLIVAGVGIACAVLLAVLLWPNRVMAPVTLYPQQVLDSRAMPAGVARKPLVAMYLPIAMPSVAPVRQPDRRARIAIVLDDMGPNRPALERASRLPPAVSFAFLPYARDVRALTAAARAAGRTVLLHMPMEPMGTADPGPGALLLSLDPAERDRRLVAALAAFDHLDGVNNHMGSRITADRAAMDAVMARLKGRGLFFLDSRTTGATKAADAAARAGLVTLSRDVFIDPDGTGAEAPDQLQRSLAIAARTGQAIAIGHPHRLTLDALEAFVATLDRTRFRLVSLSELAATQTD